MKRFQDLPAMSDTPARQRIDHLKKQGSLTKFPKIRCTGCGSKINAGVLSRVLNRLRIEHDDSVAIGLDAPDDAAVFTLPSHGKLVQTVDFFPAFLDDPWLFGRIATIHCLSDVVAMGASPKSAQVVVTLPYALDRPAEETLFQVMSGALKELHQHNAVLIGGHTLESERLALGMTVNGLPPQDRLLTKQGLVDGDRIILTKALGTGMILAAHMQGKAPSQWIATAIRQMLKSNASAIPVLQKHQVQSATDVTGFGLIGHLHEMLESSAIGAEINLNEIPLLAGATDCSRLGIQSSLAPGNRQQQSRIAHTGSPRSNAAYATLFDPQTSGGLLFGIRAEAVESCLSDLAELGWTDAREIGHVTTANAGEPIITIKGDD